MNLVKIGVVTSAHGIRGGVKIKSYTANPSDIGNYRSIFNADKSLVIELKVLAQKGNMVNALIKGITDRNMAEALIGTELYIEKSELPELEEDEFYYNDLIGMRVNNENAEHYGDIITVNDFGAGAIIEVLPLNSKKTVLYPFKKHIFTEVDLVNRVVILKLS